MQHLQELGLDTSNASMLYCELYDEEPIIVESKHRFDKEENAIAIIGIRNSVIYCKKVTPAYTLQDVLGILPSEIKPCQRRFWLRIDLSDECLYYYCDDYNLVENRKKVIGYDGVDGLTDAAYEMLCWCIENKYVKTENENMR